jgi:hypothetical protein
MAQTKPATTSYDFERKYRPGEVYRYRLTSKAVQNGTWQSTSIAVCELKVVMDSAGVPCEEVHWISKKVLTPKDTSDHTREATQVIPYRISLHPNGKLDLPKLQVADMTGEITDFNTFYVAISPKLGVAGLKQKGDQHQQQAPLQGNFANGKDILAGNDCIVISLLLEEKDKNTVSIKTSFLPPADSCLHYLTSDMSAPVEPGTINNFQMVRAFSGSRVNVLYGREDFIINTNIQQRDGKIATATMINNLHLKIKLNCDDQYAGCQMTMPFTIQRTLQLELLP